MIGNTLNFKGRNLVNGEGRTIFTTRELNAEMTGDIVNSKAELLSQGSMTLKAGTVDNTVGKIRGAGDVSITATRVENKGKAGDLTKYRVYWETWNGRKYNSLAEVNAGWKIHPVTTKSGSTEDKEATFDYLTDKFSEKNGDTSYIFKSVRRK